MDLVEGWYYLAYQQVYKAHNIIFDRGTKVKIPVDGTKKIFDTVLQGIVAFTPLWEKRKVEFFTRVCSYLHLSVARVIGLITNKFAFDPFNESTWETMAFTEEQVYMFSIGQIWDIFFQALRNLGYETVSFENWDKEEAVSKLAHEYSLLSNLLYLNQMGKRYDVEVKELDAVISKLKPLFEANDFEGYTQEISKIKLP